MHLQLHAHAPHSHSPFLTYLTPRGPRCPEAAAPAPCTVRHRLGRLRVRAATTCAGPCPCHAFSCCNSRCCLDATGVRSVAATDADPLPQLAVLIEREAANARQWAWQKGALVSMCRASKPTMVLHCTPGCGCWAEPRIDDTSTGSTHGFGAVGMRVWFAGCKAPHTHGASGVADSTGGGSTVSPCRARPIS